MKGELPWPRQDWMKQKNVNQALMNPEGHRDPEMPHLEVDSDVALFANADFLEIRRAWLQRARQ